MYQSRFMVLFCLMAALLISLLPGCSGSSSSSSPPTGTLKVGLTDKQSDAYQNVVIAIREIRLVPAGMESARDDDPGLPLLVSYPTPHTVDVLTLRFQQELLNTVVIPAGTYNQVRLILEPNPNGQVTPLNYLTLKSDPTVKIPLKTPSGQQSGLKVLGRFEVKPGVINAILIDFDPNTAIVDRGNGDYNLKPTGIRIVQTSDYLASFGALTGTVVSTFKDWSSATLSVVPQGSSNPIAAGRLFSNYTSGRWEAPFSAFVPDGTYRVHVQTSRFNAYSSPLTTVTGGVESSLGDILLVPAP